MTAVLESWGVSMCNGCNTVKNGIAYMELCCALHCAIGPDSREAGVLQSSCSWAAAAAVFIVTDNIAGCMIQIMTNVL